MRTINTKSRLRTCSLYLAILLVGCNHSRPEVSYLGEPEHQYYKGEATKIAFPNVESDTAEEVYASGAPHTIRDRDKLPIREVTLAEAVQSALQNNEIIRTGGAFEQTGSSLVNAPDRVPSVYDPAIQESGVLFGSRGTEAALAAFDAQLRASYVYGRNTALQNNTFITGGQAELKSDTGAFASSLSKSFAHGGSIIVNHDVNYLGTNGPGTFPSSYSGNVGFNYQLPLLAGAGTDFTRTAGPITQSFGGLSGVSQGVLIARINQDISLADFEISVQNLVRDVEDTYWDLYLAYRNYHTAVTAYESALLTWRIADLQLKGGVRTSAEVAQSRDQLFTAKAASETFQSQIYTMETKLRRLMGLSVNDGFTLRPADEPVSAELIPDWYSSLTTSLFQRTELRRQKWNIKSLELQLRAAESLTRPRLDLVTGYRVNGFGDTLFSQSDSNNFYGSIADTDQTGWNLGVQMQWDLGLRSARAQVQNYELRLAKAYKLLQEQEKDVSHELAVTFQEIARTYTAAETNMNRLLAARDNVRFLEPNIREGDKLLDDLLRAQERQAQAEVAYYRSLVEYNQALTSLQYRQGTLLAHNNIQLAEGGWDTPAYQDAMHHYKARAYAKRNDHTHEAPEQFASDAPVGGVYFTEKSPTFAEEIILPEEAFEQAPTPVAE